MTNNELTIDWTYRYDDHYLLFINLTQQLYYILCSIAVLLYYNYIHNLQILP